MPGSLGATWLERRRANLLPTEYFHVVFTVPLAVAEVATQNKAVVYDLLFRAVAETLRTIAADPRHLGAEIGFFAILTHLGPDARPSSASALPLTRVDNPAMALRLEGPDRMQLDSTHPEIRRTLWRGARRRCPHCGRGPLFVRGIRLHARCNVCGLTYLRNQGDTWLYVIVMDRIPIAIGLILIYFFGLHTPSWPQALLFFAAMAVPLVATTPQRQGIAVALNYLSRVYFRDPSDDLPESPPHER